MIKIGFYYTGVEDLRDILDYNVDILIRDESLIEDLREYNKVVRVVKHIKDRYDLLISYSDDIGDIRAIKRYKVKGKLDLDKLIEEQKSCRYKFSIIVPNYNNGEWIDKTIESVLNQTYKNWEMYIIDDMSTDNSIEVIERYKDDRIKLIKNEIKLYNGGSRNIGILKARKSNYEGYLLFIDSDDWLKDKYVLERLERYITDEDLITLDYQYYMNNKIGKEAHHTYKDIDDLFMTNGAMCAVWCKCFKVSVAPLFEFNTLMEDRNYHYRLINRIKTYSNYGEVTHIWNKSNNKSITTDRKQHYNSELQGKIEWNNCAYRHIAGMKDLLNEIEKPEWKKFIKDRIKANEDNLKYGIYQQF